MCGIEYKGAVRNAVVNPQPPSPTHLLIKQKKKSIRSFLRCLSLGRDKAFVVGGGFYFFFGIHFFLLTSKPPLELASGEISIGALDIGGGGVVEFNANGYRFRYAPSTRYCNIKEMADSLKRG